MPSCLLCTKETDQRCSQCLNTHYCSQECQETDWHSLHRHECARYRAPVSLYMNAGAGGQADARPDARGAAPQAKTLVDEIDEDRVEYDRMVSMIRQYIANRQPTKKEASMTKAQRDELARRVQHMILDPREESVRQRAKFLTSVKRLIDTLNLSASPQIQLDGPLMTRIGVMMRRYDVLHLKQTYLLMTRDQQAEEDVAQYRAHMDEHEKRFVHSLLIGDNKDPAVSYETIQRKIHEAEMDALIAEHVKNSMDAAVHHTAAICIRYLEALDSAEAEEKKKGQFGMVTGKQGEAKPKKRFATAKRGSDAEQEARTDTNTRGMFGARDNDDPEVHGYTAEAMADVVATSLGDLRARLDVAYQEGRITDVVRLNTQIYFKRIGRDILGELTNAGTFTYMNNFSEATVWEQIQHMSTYPMQCYEMIKKHYGLDYAWKTRLKLNTFWSVLCLVTIFTFCLQALGCTFFSDPYSPEMRTQLAQTDVMGTTLTQNIAVVGSVAVATKSAQYMAQSYSSMMNATVGSAQYKFMDLNPNDPGIDALTNRILANTTLTGLLGRVEKMIDDTIDKVIAEAELVNNPVPLLPRDQPIRFKEGTLNFLENFKARIVKIQESPTLFDARHLIDDLQTSIESMTDISTYMGQSVLVDEVRQIIDSYRAYANVMDLKLTNMTRLLDEQTSSMKLLQEATYTQRDHLRKVAMDAPVFGSLLRRIGIQLNLGLSAYSPTLEAALLRLLETGVLGATFLLFGGRTLNAFGPYTVAERMFHDLAQGSGIHNASILSYDFFSSVAYMLHKSPLQYMTMWGCAALSLSLIYTPASYLGATGALWTTSRIIVKTIAETCRLGKMVDPDTESGVTDTAYGDYESDDRDYLRAKQVVSVIQSNEGNIRETVERGGNVDIYMEELLRHLTEGTLTNRQYNIAVELMMDRKPLSYNVFMNYIGTTLDGWGAILKVISVLFRLYLILDYYVKLLDVFWAFWALMQTSNIFLAFVLVGIIAIVVSFQNSRARAEFEIGSLYEYIIPSFDALFRLFSYPTYPKTLFVNFLYMTTVTQPTSILTFAGFIASLYSPAVTEREALRNNTEFLNHPVATNVSNYSNALVVQSKSMINDFTSHMAHVALIAKGTDSDVEAWQEASNRLVDEINRLESVDESSGGNFTWFYRL